MRVREAHSKDMPRAVELARMLGLDYPGIDSDMIWVAEEFREIVGLVVLKKHPDCLELCGLGVDPGFRGKGLGKALIEVLMAAAPGDVYLATVIPEFFEACGFERAVDIPATFPEKRKTAWCEGCPQERCTVMLRKKP